MVPGEGIHAMPNLGNWMGGTPDLGSIDPMFDISGIMARRGVAITLNRTAPRTNTTTTIAAQTVIPTPLSRYQAERAGITGYTGQAMFVLIGYRSYPGKTDFDVQKDDRFLYGGSWYRVIYIDDVIPYRREAYAESAQ